jgi:hypothetical protein
MPAHTHAHTHARTVHARTHVRECVHSCLAPRVDKHTHWLTHAGTHARTHARTHAHHPRMHACLQARTHVCAFVSRTMCWSGKVGVSLLHMSGRVCLCFVSARTNKRHHCHHPGWTLGLTSLSTLLKTASSSTLSLWRGAGGGSLLAGTRWLPAQGTKCPLLYRYLTHTYCSLARLPPTHPFVSAPILQLHFQVRWLPRLPPPRVLLPHTRRMDGFCNQNADQLGSLARLSFPAVYVGVVQLCSLAGLCFPVVYVGVVE